MEIATRALSFWTYQTTQEACFQEMMYRDLQEKYQRLEKHLHMFNREARTEFCALREKLSALEKELELEKRKNVEINDQLQEKGRQFTKLQASSNTKAFFIIRHTYNGYCVILYPQLQSMYDQLKRRTLVPTMTRNATGNGRPGTTNDVIQYCLLHNNNPDPCSKILDATFANGPRIHGYSPVRNGQASKAPNRRPFSGPPNAGMRFMPPATRGTTR
ncbi:6279_t:CDS:2 [Paraglomus brasilianum]|uniref:6279_t:CDS:1 n=1 Tax=Paraglomus brasilianum TaxID=144538 RepID=A0A9N9FIS2_9GLOM|nr:6279_t:CDS:2 [Paraglomus brasilianum]